jgi:hypothetical protein
VGLRPKHYHERGERHDQRRSIGAGGYSDSVALDFADADSEPDDRTSQHATGPVSLLRCLPDVLAEHHETAVSPITTAADREELELPSRQAPSQVNSAGLRRVCIKKDGSVVE